MEEKGNIVLGLSYQEWRNSIDVQEDNRLVSLSISFKETPQDLEQKIRDWYKELANRGDKNLLREYAEWFNLLIEKK